jgi:nuclear cap-binding protein subunit 1
MAKVISADSMFSLLQSFTAVLDEFGVSHSRAKKAALCAAEGLMIVCISLQHQRPASLLLTQGGPVLKPNPATNVTSLIDAIQSYHDVAGTTKWLVQPLVRLSSDSAPAENADEVSFLLLR